MGNATIKEEDALGDSSYLKQFGKAVRHERTLRGFSQEGFADHMEMDRSYVGGIERGERNPSLTNVMRIMEGLAMEPSEFFAAHISLHRKRRAARKRKAAD
ncbi:MAG: helix-turn-helix transcriptional regulator [Proteobacteria bacterium]|nr:helix-turn-helix transcriptional regulator [Pseudomonadota bacterium]